MFNLFSHLSRMTKKTAGVVAGLIGFFGLLVGIIVAGPQIEPGVTAWRSYLSPITDGFASLIEQQSPIPTLIFALVAAVLFLAILFGRDVATRTGPNAVTQSTPMDGRRDPGPKPPQDRMPVEEVIWYVAKDTKWSHDLQSRKDQTANDIIASGAVANEIEQAAIEGRIQIWGKKIERRQTGDFRIREPIPNDYWKNYGINVRRTLSDPDADGGATEHRKFSDHDHASQRYDSLEIDRHSVRVEWPAQLRV